MEISLDNRFLDKREREREMSTTKEEAHHNDMSMFGKVIVDRLKKLRIFIWGTQAVTIETFFFLFVIWFFFCFIE